VNKKQPEVKFVNVQVCRKIPLIPKTCPVCGKTFVGAKLAKYDSLQCKQKASYERHVEARRATRREKYQAEKQTSASKK
jgi:hypothetical protein